MKPVKPPMTEIERDQARGMLARGDHIQHVAYWFGRSLSTIWAIKKKGERYEGLAELPPQGPYELVARRELTVIVHKASMYDKAEAERLAACAIVNELEQLVAKYKRLRGASATVPLEEQDLSVSCVGRA